MTINEIIAELEEAKKMYGGDTDVLLLMNNGDDTQLPIEFPLLELFKYKGSVLYEEGQIRSEYENCLISTAFTDIDEDIDSLYDPEWEE